MSLNRSIAAAVREQMARHGLTQLQAAAAVGLSQQALSDRLTGQTRFTDADLERLGHLFGIDPRELLQPRAVEPIVSPPLLANAQAERERRERVSA